MTLPEVNKNLIIVNADMVLSNAPTEIPHEGL